MPGYEQAVAGKPSGVISAEDWQTIAGDEGALSNAGTTITYDSYQRGLSSIATDRLALRKLVVGFRYQWQVEYRPEQALIFDGQELAARNQAVIFDGFTPRGLGMKEEKQLPTEQQLAILAEFHEDIGTRFATIIATLPNFQEHFRDRQLARELEDRLSAARRSHLAARVLES